MTRESHARRLDELVKILESLEKPDDLPDDLSEVNVDRGI